MGVFVVGCYRPKPGREADLDRVAADHLPVLRAAGLATDRASVLLRATDGTLVEVFEWRSKEAIAAAHEHPDVLALWERYDACCEYVTLSDLPGATELWPEYRLVQWPGE
jgi:hypothetical protein